MDKMSDADMEIMKNCADENGIDINEKGRSRSETPSPERQCFLKCLLEKREIIDKDGKVDEQKVKLKHQAMGMELDDETFECLKKLPPIKECKDVSNFHQCMKRRRVSTP
uniref:Odorant-binding protein 12 n=1 Tax=Dastarcus helophoroides TaxID=1169899 RepID=A0A1I9HZQ0_9CUCU|nr:odorant-binding protein 12 [Dastarcus helophoroides]